MRQAIRFIFGEQDCALADVALTMTVLEWLRTRAGACGTEERLRAIAAPAPWCWVSRRATQ